MVASPLQQSVDSAVRSARFIGRYVAKRLRRAPGVVWSAMTGKIRLLRLRGLTDLSSTVVFVSPSGRPLVVRLSGLAGSASRTVKLGSHPLKVLEAQGVVFEPHQEVLLQGGRAYVQSAERFDGAKLPPEDLALGSNIVVSSSRTLAWAVRQPSGLPVLNAGILLNGRFPSNWYHWVINILPKLFLADLCGRIPRDVPVLISEQIRGTRMHEVLNVVNRSRRQLIFLPEVPHLVETAYIVEGPVRELSHVKGLRRFSWDALGSFHSGLMADYRDFLRQWAMSGTTGTISTRHERVFLARGAKTRPFNQQEVEASLKRLGFATIDLEKLSFVEQVRVFAQARVVVSTTGAQWTGFLFSENSVGLVLIPAFLGGSSLFAKLGYAGNCQLYEEHIYTREASWLRYFGSQSPATVDVTSLEKSLRTLLDGLPTRDSTAAF
jgi:hypothetical protein